MKKMKMSRQRHIALASNKMGNHHLNYLDYRNYNQLTNRKYLYHNQQPSILGYRYIRIEYRMMVTKRNMEIY